MFTVYVLGADQHQQVFPTLAEATQHGNDAVQMGSATHFFVLNGDGDRVFDSRK